MYKYLLVFLLSINVAFASGAKLVDFIFNNVEFGKILTKNGILLDDSKQVQSYVASSLNALGIKPGSDSKRQLLQALEMAPATSKADQDRIRGLKGMLDMPVDQVSDKQLVATVNSLIYIANRYGKSVIITCAECVNPTLAKKGFEFSVETIQNATSAGLLKSVIPSNPKDLNNFISSRMKKLGMGDYSKVTPDMVAPQDEKTLALFLALAENGSADQKSLVASIKKLSTTGGKANVINPKNPHKFWKIVADDMSPKDTAAWISTMDEVAAKAAKEKLSIQDAFYKTLKDKAGSDPYLTKQYETLKAKGCFFK